MRLTVLTLVLSLVVPFAISRAQNCVPTPALAGAVTVDGLYLDVIGSQGGTDSRAMVPDYTAASGLGHLLTVSLLSTIGPAGEPFGIFYSLGGAHPPFNVGGPGRDVFLDIGQTTPFPTNFYALIDGVGIVSNQWGVSTLPAPLSFNLAGTVPPIAQLAGQCITVQAASIRPSAPFGLALSNPALLQIRPTVQALAPSQFQAESAIVVASVIGSGPTGDLAELSDGFGGVVQLPATSGSFTVPVGVSSGPVGYVLAAAPTVPSARNPDRRESWLSVTDATVSTLPPGTITLTTTPTLGLSRFTARNALSAATAVNDDYIVNLNAGDLVEIEVLSVDVTGALLLDGYGNQYNLSAAQGFNPQVTLRAAANLIPLLYDTGLTGGFNVHQDNDSGPGGSAFLRFQCRQSDAYIIRINTSRPQNYVTGDYLLNICVRSGVLPSINTVGMSLINPTNVFQPAATVTVQASNLLASLPYTFILTPVHGLFPPTVITGLATSATQATFNIPATLVAGMFTVGSYRVQIEEPASMRRSLLYPTSPLRPVFGVVPDLLTVRAAPANTVVGSGAAITPLIANTATMTFTGVGAGGFGQFTANPGQMIYIEAFGVDNTITNRLDTALAVSGAAQGIWNPQLRVWTANGLGTVIGFDDADGTFPNAYFPQPIGFGDNAAILIPSNAVTANSNHTFLVTEHICWVACGARTGFVNVVVQ